MSSTGAVGPAAAASNVDPFAGLHRIARRDLAENRTVWRANAAMYVVVGVAALVLLALGGAEHPAALAAFAICAGAVATVLLCTKPARVDAVANHVVVASTYVFMAFGLFAFQPGIETAIAIAIFVGPLTAARIDRRGAFAAHLVAMTALLTVVAVAGGLAGVFRETTLVAALLIALATWCLGISCLLVLEAAEAQGDDLEQLVRSDPLTGVGNRRMLAERLDEELELHLAQRRPLSVIVVDLDGFKELNDTVGHAAGDELLRDVAAALVGVVRPGDAVVRQGGDEFCLILVDTPAAEANHVADAVRAALGAVQIDGRPLTGGVGVATCPADAATRAELLEIADARLVQGKRERPPES